MRQGLLFGRHLTYSRHLTYNRIRKSKGETAVNASILYISSKKKRPRRRRKAPLVIAAIAIVIAAFGVFGWLFSRPSEAQNITYVGTIPVHEDFLPEGAAARPGTKRRIEHIVLHETDNFAAGANAKAHNSFIHQNGQTEELSWHYTVDDKEIYHHLPDDEAAYHASDRMEKGGGNLNGIGVELCVNEDGDYAKTLENAVLLTATLMDEYHLRLSDIKKHEDFSGKICPAKLIANDEWDSFLQRVQAAYEEIRAKDET